ncbi:VanZ family protein [Paenibacillus sp. UNC499MF]|uniref:VanZ family protein n=1 Tax=Paenibacillus sp. UNC499MF TaxID=1502751 RepID=UPI0008A02F43|nr:VanZ family protein [Paenibacillus sp. UNC499MF]SEG75098.1 Glycopeptide antibiotics resistance protein [Paenibacillus sp. UNC499MF]
MYQGKLRKMTLFLLVSYTALTLYFLYIGFDRSSRLANRAMRYNLNPQGIPLHFPMGRDFQSWIFEFGNFAAFIPFGLLIPLLFRSKFIPFIGCFLVSITFLETMQMLTRLGSFDINDIVINTLGAAVGYGAQRLVPGSRDNLRGIVRLAVMTIILSAGTVAAVGGMNDSLEKGSRSYLFTPKELPPHSIVLHNEVQRQRAD